MNGDKLTEMSIFMAGVLQGEIGVTKEVRKRFIKTYKELLDNGYYIGKKKGAIIISNKRPEVNKKQRENYDEFIKNIFIKC